MSVTLDKTWECTTLISNVSLPSNYWGQQFAWEIKNALVGAGWSVSRSCNSLMVSESNEDLWLSYQDIKFAVEGSAHSWVILKNPSFMLGFEFCIATNSLNYVDVSFEAVPEGYNYDGTISSRPTPVGVAMTWAGNLTTPNHNYSKNNVIKVLRSTDNKIFRMIMTNEGECSSENINNGRAGQAILFERPKYPPSWWANPVIVGRFEHTSGFGYSPLTVIPNTCLKTVVDGTVITVSVGTVGVGGWVSRNGLYSFGMSYDGNLAMPPIYFFSNNSIYPGILGIMYDAYPINPYHAPGTRYPTTTNRRGLMKAGPLAIGCPYGPMVV